MELQNLETSTHPETMGFDLSTGNTWIYPENYPIRQYQYNIVKSALFHNTLVCLPTGLGKTFIAAVVMYNFWRWYPFGKIIFLAPTKPLVAQQINACYEVMGIQNIDMIELTGAVNQKNRKIAWIKKRIIFATPQVFHNDLEKLIVPSHLIKCVVIDEAHKALGKHSYSECIKILSTQNQYFRILALSATPGNKIDNVHEVIQNLHISHLELREENSIDIMPYINKRKVDIILVPLSDELAAFKERYIIIMDRHVRFLMQYNVLRGHTANISKGRIFHLMREFKTKTDKSGNYGQIMKTLTILFTMYHAYELMIRHGLRAFCKFYATHSDKFWMNSEDQLQNLLRDIEIYLGPFPEVYPNGDVSEIPTDIIFGHNKFHKLKELLEHHFNSNNDDRKDTRAIVFVEYRDIVNEVYILLMQSKPIIRPQMFVGQAGQKQKQQIKALEDFRNNRVNVLISTSIGEEGLDVGEVDLIICFDVSQHSPIRLVQRMGRTGRKRDGHIIVLVTDGKEHENLKSTLSRRDSLNNKILNTSNIFSSLYENDPRMIPNQFTPECHKIHIIVSPKTPNVKNKKKKDINKKKQISRMKQKENLSKKENTGQSSMMKFLTDNKHNEQNQTNAYNIFIQLTTQNSNKYNTINPNNVKLLTDDNMGIEFLTLCAMKKSEAEIYSEAVPKVDTTYIPASKSIKDLFNFVVPDIEILNDLSFLTENNEDNLSTHCKSNEDENIIDSNDYLNIENFDDNFWCSIRNEENIDNKEVRFEDILDESSDSNDTAILDLNQRIENIEIDLINTNRSPVVVDMKEDDKIITDTRTELSTNVLEDLEPSIFENILNESFSSVEDDSENKADIEQQKISLNSLNASANDTREINEKHKTDINIFHDESNIAKNNQNLSAFMKFDKPHQKGQLASFLDEIQDLNFNSDDDINEFIKCDINNTEKNKSLCNSKTEESLLSITQAISEIAQTKKNVGISRRFSVNKKKSTDEESCGWISVNIKNDIKAKKNDTDSRTNMLSNIHCNSIAKSHTNNQDFDFLDDSNKDFMIIKDNTKKFNELESSYFCNSPKKSEYDNCMPSTSKKSEIVDSYFDNTSKNLKIKDTYFDNSLKDMKPCGVSTPKHRRLKLSLKRDKIQHSDTIDLSVFAAPSRYMNNTVNKSTLKPSSGAPKQIFHSNEKVAQKTKYRLNCKNEFIDDEVEVDSDASSDEIITDDEDLGDFVSYTQNPQEQVDMHAHYLQTIKSPMKRPGAFHFRDPRPKSDIDIYSQFSPSEQDSYLCDSFCVTEDAEPSMLVRNDSLLDEIERKLERNRRKRLCSDKNTKHIKKKKTILNHSMSSEDEIEKLRVQVQED
ncbi:LOW QUALITY PROTEIN: ATP-dependent DNA helicase MPH1 [Pogonomyrmex barbatus]|uniref:LOW QUALITY PROTEIN: ATP-dependent DNA helicase MPH1 n=1 Tax=Pogonomyrmex barbatus TaxID=144034 RepID=A0A6I9X225_9HYME|nr:LOW QUALITY PROTEIN: ATP-dependent DNA helicase MPH1 [Pogonomyrmex barbatus]